LKADLVFIDKVGELVLPRRASGIRRPSFQA
jgi:hypothetical protein